MFTVTQKSPAKDLVFNFLKCDKTGKHLGDPVRGSEVIA